MKKTVLITGATSGIGLATAELFARNNYKLIICGRRAERLKAFKDRYGSGPDIHTLIFDIRNKADVFCTDQFTAPRVPISRCAHKQCRQCAWFKPNS
jgi:NADP-dependent 3-hydroxy acid dehydrogenase YdfG